MKTTKTTQQIIKNRNDEKIVRIKDAITNEEIKANSTGFVKLNELMSGGFRKGDLVVLSGRSGNGKTTVGLNFMKNFVALNPVLFSYEVQIDRVYESLQTMMMGEDPNIFTPKRNVSGNVDWIKDRIIEAIGKYKSSFIVIDHLDFITSDHTSDDGRRNEINSIITRLKTLAVEKGLIIVLQVHVRKGNGDSQALGNSDLADSRSIANLADFVMFANREMGEDNIAVGNEGRIVLTKNRYNGKQGKMDYTVDSNGIITEIEEYKPYTG